MFLSLVDSLEVLKLYKYIYDIQRLVDPPIAKLLSRGEQRLRMGRLAPPVDGMARPCKLSQCKSAKLTGNREGWSGNLKRTRALSRLPLVYLT